MNNCNSSDIEKEPTFELKLGDFEYSNRRSLGKRKENRTKEHENQDPFFLGREKLLTRLIDHLINGSKGSYLVSGYRGAGKSRFVEEALKEAQNKQCTFDKSKKDWIDVRINLGSDSKLDSRTVLFSMISLLEDNFEQRIRKGQSRYDCLDYFVLKQNKTFILSSLFLLSLLLLSSNQINNYLCLSEPILVLALWTFSSLICFGIVSSVSSSTAKKKPILKHYLEILSLKNEIHAAYEQQFKIENKFFFYGAKELRPPLDNNQIEDRLRRFLDNIVEKEDIKIIFIFDELDKLTGNVINDGTENLDLVKETKLRKKQVDGILGDLKNLVTASNAKFIFIAGRDMYDAYLSERGSTNSLYESLFNDHIYIPSLLTDHSDQQVYLLDSMIEAFLVSHLLSKNQKKQFKEGTKEKYTYLTLREFAETINEDARIQTNFILKIFLHFLTLHSWGNYKRLITLFESFVVVEEGTKEDESTGYSLVFYTVDIQRFILASNLYIMFHHNLSRILMNSDDKLVVSAFSLFHQILKYHGFGFSRENILRMYETVNIHSSPELAKILDVILYTVLRNHIRRIRNGFYRYRFSFLHEKEIHFITNINDDESAAFSFSLNAMDSVKQHFRNLITSSHYSHTDENYGSTALASIHVVVGNFHFWEQSYDEAQIHYGIAIDILNKEISSYTSNIDKINVILQLVEVYLRQGSVAERVGSYAKASAIYLNAEIRADECLKIVLSTGVKSHDSKWDVLKQPRWAKNFLNLKRSGIHYLHDTSNFSDLPGATDVTKYREAVLLLFLENPKTSYRTFLDVARSVDHASERSYFLLGNAYLKAAFSLLVEESNRLYEELQIERSCYQDKNSNEAICSVLVKSLSYLIDFLGKIHHESEFEFKHFNPKNLDKFEEEIKNKNINRHNLKSEDNHSKLIPAFKLMHLSASYFSQGRLNLNTAISKLSIVMMWSALLDFLPWRQIISEEFSSNCTVEIKDEEDGRDKSITVQEAIKYIQKKIDNFHSDSNASTGKSNYFIYVAQESALKHISYNTGKAFSHFIKTTSLRNLGNTELPKPFELEGNPRDLFLHPSFLQEQMNQHFSVFGQLIIASMYWEELIVKNINSIRIPVDGDGYISREKDVGDQLIKGEILPYSIRYYSTMLWLKGREYLSRVLESESDNEITFDSKSDIISNSLNGIITLFRSAQYVTKTYGESSSMSLPPLFIIYYNMWEILFKLASIQIQKIPGKSFEEAVYCIRAVLDKTLLEINSTQKEKVTDISSRVFDLSHVETIALEQLRIVERMKDLNSKDRTNILRNKYFLDDDFEDNVFNLDWFYCRFFAPGALVYRMIIKNKMNSLRKKCSNDTASK
ncbi:hypothetical protein W03_17830 [Nitrosomonas sp. PY1]|uniref:ATP-binding protein n=1 Tax=Nitrosomonas sp. PY1 TaxID=1803906 RepID=UPI001FC89144|nr:ATP-binding protein [Nitrosomonas sp. PY1]GKS69779.1 hypothetical protein W03_17830 [Nitrosomonas sp. PY1]